MSRAYLDSDMYSVSGADDLNSDKDMLAAAQRMQKVFESRGKEEDNKLYKVNPNFVLREIAGESILIPVGEAGVLENTVISLNETCRFLWNLFLVPRRIQDAILEAQKQFSAPEEIIVGDIYRFVNEYLQYGLLQEG